MAQRQGVKVESIARRFGVSRRTVFRALAKARAGNAAGGGR
jgi:transposase-like protein